MFSVLGKRNYLFTDSCKFTERNDVLSVQIPNELARPMSPTSRCQQEASSRANTHLSEPKRIIFGTTLNRGPGNFQTTARAVT
mmetsp:Transcript_40613/g.67458  ORF Transcript_40613/g.67458 Transcript_40613/m.67458 type:complete len:83 (-) Transcript_40613:127-375(-)